MLSVLLFGFLQAAPAKWVVQEVTPAYTPSGMVASPIRSFQLGDMGGDGADEVLFSLNDLVAGGERLIFSNPGRGPMAWFLPWRNMRGAQWAYWTVTRGPTGLLLTGGGPASDWKLASFDPRVGLTPVVRSTVGMPMFLVKIPDVSGDGREDLFYQNTDTATWGASGVFDGQDLTVLWNVDHSGNLHPRTFHKDNAGPMPDLDGDGIPEVLSSWMVYDRNASIYDLQWAHDILALSGADGSLIWEAAGYDSGGSSGALAVGPDVTGDGVPDVYWVNMAFMALFSGADGSEVWGFDPQAAFGQTPPSGYSYWSTLWPTTITGTYDGRIDLVVPADYAAIGVGIPDLYALGHFEATTGAFLGLAELPADLQPWYPDPFVNGWNQPLHPLGDVDRDGLKELGFVVPVPSVDPDLGPIFTLSMETLSVPPQLQVGMGNGFDAEVSIPSGANRPCYLLLSRSFDRNGGLLVDGWKTHLGPDPWLDRSSTTRSLQVQLDTQGRGTIHVPIPPDPNLVGATVYTRAVVLESAAPDAEVWTVSTPGVTELVL